MEPDRRKIAENLFEEGYNCAQAVALAFSDVLKTERESIASAMSSFGGGIARMREVCGAVSGMAFVLGVLYGPRNPDSFENKSKHYERVQALARKFEERNGSIVCRELLGLSERHSPSKPEERTAEFKKKRPCRELVGIAAEMLAEYVKNNPPD